LKVNNKMGIEINEYKVKVLERLCSALPFNTTIFEEKGYCTLCSRDCFYAKIPSEEDKKILCTKKNYTFLDETSPVNFKIPHLA